VAKLLKVAVFWDVMPCNLEDHSILNLICSSRQSIGVSGNGQNTQAANLSASSKSCSFSYINGSKVAAQDDT
jgi:hypothetical protein